MAPARATAHASVLWSVLRCVVSEEILVAGALGWLGTVGTFIAYVLLVRGRITAGSAQYAALNVLGGLLCGSASLVWHAWPSVASNFVWAAVGTHTLLLSLRRRAVVARARRRVARAAAAGVHSRAIVRSRRRVRAATAPGPAVPEQRHDGRRPTESRRGRRGRSRSVPAAAGRAHRDDSTAVRC